MNLGPLRVLFARRRGMALVNFIGVVLVLVFALASYRLKTQAGVVDAEAERLDEQIAEESKAVRLLKARIVTLGSPQRVADLSRDGLGLAPIDPHRQIGVEQLPAVAANATPPAALQTRSAR